MYGLFKIHKDVFPLRPIVNCRDSACHPLSCFLVEIDTPLTGKFSSSVLIICNALIHSNQIESLDLVNLFMKVLTDKTLTVVRDKLATDPFLEECTCIPVDNLMEMLTFCMKAIYFKGVTYTKKKRG